MHEPSALSYRHRTTRCSLLVVACVAIAVSSIQAVESAPGPNLVFILADDLGWSDTTLYGTTSFYETPNIGSPRTGTVWYRFALEADGPILVDLTRPLPLELPSVTDAVAVYTGAALDSLTEVACGSDEVTFSAEAGTTYYLQVYGYTSAFDLFASSSGLVHLESMSPRPEEVP